MNTLRVGLLMAAVTALFLAVGNALGGSSGLVIALVLAIVMNFVSYWFSDKIVLAMTRAQPVSPSQAPGLYKMVERLSQRAGIPMPKLYVVPDPSPNAFATGRSPQRGVVAVNQGLLDVLDQREVEGVIAHEIAHIKHRDTLTMAIVATFAGAISTLANMAMWASIFGGRSDEEGGGFGDLLAILFAPIAATMIQMGVSRLREYEADKTAAYLVGSPQGLKSALIKLHRGVERVPGHMPPAAAHMCIVNPFGSLGRGMLALFQTHPPFEERVRKLDELGLQMRSAA